MENLIDINKSNYSETETFEDAESVFRFRELTWEIKLDAAIVGGLWGFLITIGIAIPVFLLFYLLEVREGEFSGEDFMGMVITFLVFGSGLGALIGNVLQKKESKNGYLKISDNYVEYWTRKGNKTIMTSEIFGTGPVKGTIRRFTRFYYLSSEPRGFAFLNRSFKYYIPVSGPAMKLALNEGTGDDIVREAVILHINRRQKQQLRVAEFPPYAFTAIQSRKEHYIYGDTVIDAIFECDGKTIKYTKKDEVKNIPLTSIEDVKIVEVRSKHGRTAYYIDLTVSPSVSLDKIRINILRIPKPTEIDKYCRAIPTLFPEAQSGYWD